MDGRDQDAAELLRALVEGLRAQREETVALREAIVRRLEDVSRNT